MCVHGLCQSAQSRLQPSEYILPRDGFFEEICFNFTEYEEGFEQLTIQPYRLRLKQVFGWLADFHFRVREGVPFSRRVQQLSLSLDKNLKRNLDCYLDRTIRIKAFLEQRMSVLNVVSLPGTEEPIKSARDFIVLSAKRLRSKTYLFSGDRDARSQFTGLRQCGPLEPLVDPPKLRRQHE